MHESFWTRVRFPAPPPIFMKKILITLLLISTLCLNAKAYDEDYNRGHERGIGMLGLTTSISLIIWGIIPKYEGVEEVPEEIAYDLASPNDRVYFNGYGDAIIEHRKRNIWLVALGVLGGIYSLKLFNGEL